MDAKFALYTYFLFHSFGPYLFYLSSTKANLTFNLLRSSNNDNNLCFGVLYNQLAFECCLYSTRWDSKKRVHFRSTREFNPVRLDW